MFFALLGIVAFTAAFAPNVISRQFEQIFFPSPDEQSVLQAATQNNLLSGEIEFYLPSIFNENVFVNADASVSGTFTAPNILYGIIAGDNITITDGQTPTISAALEVIAGTGITVGDDGTITNEDPGSTQNIFKNVKVGSNTISAGSNADTFEIAAGSNVSLSTDTGTKKITISSSGFSPSGLTTNGVLYADSATNFVSLTPGTAGYVLQSNGTGSPPSWVVNTATTPTFDIIESGTNTIATMVVGTGASLNFSGSGTINASTLGGATFAAPGAIGGTTPGSGAFTSLSGTTITASGLLSANAGITVANGQATTLSSFTSNNNSILYTNASGIVDAATTTSTGLCLISNGAGAAPSWGSCSASANYWDITNGVITPTMTSTLDFLLGSTATASAKFAVTNINSGTPTASLSGGMYFTGDGQLRTTNRQSLTLGGGNTGNIVLSGFTTGIVHVDASGVLSSSAVNLASSDVTGTLTVGRGGTGVTSFGGTNTILYTTATDTLAAITTANNGVLITSGAGVPSISSTLPSAVQDNITRLGTIASGTWNADVIGAAYGGTGDDTSGTTGVPYISSGNWQYEAQLGIARGGTGTSSTPTSGQILIGTSGGGYSVANLTAGNGISIANGSGTIEISQAETSLSKWTQSDNLGILYPNLSTLDLLVGATATTSAKFAVLNVAGGTPVASVSAGTAGGMFISANGSLQTTNNQSLTLGGDATGNIVLSGIGTGVLHTTNGVLSSSDVILATETSGNYVGGISGNSQISVSGSGSENASVSLSIAADSIGDSQLAFDTGQHLTNTSSPTFNGLSLTSLTIASDTIDEFVGTGLQLVSGDLQTTLGVDIDLASNEVIGILPIANGGSPFEQANGSIFQRITTQDFLLGGTASDAAKFAFLNNASGTPTASFSAGLNGGLFLTANGTLATTNKQSLTLGDGNTGNIVLGLSALASCSALETVNGILTCGTDDVGVGSTNYWQLGDGAISPFSETLDVLFGSTATASAEFAITGIADGTPVATLSAIANNTGLALSASDARIQSLNMGTLTIGGSTTGQILFDSGSGLITLADATIINQDLTVLGGDITGANGETIDIGEANNGSIIFTGTGETNNNNFEIDLETNLYPTLTSGASVIGIDAVLQFVGNQNLTSTGNLSIDATGSILFSDFSNCTALSTVGTTLTCGVGTNWNISNGTLQPKIASTLDLLIGGTATTSAKFAVLNVNSGTPVASISGGLNGTAAYLTADGKLATTNKQSLTLGDGNTGNIVLGLSALASCSALETVNGVLTCGTDDTGATTNYWQVVSPGTLAPFNETVDLLIGGVGTSSAEFAITGIAAGTPTATLSASTNGNGIYLNASNSVIQSLQNATLTIGGDSTGHIILSPLSGSGIVTSTGSLNLASGKTFQINGTDVLSATTLGTSIITSSLTTVGALDSGSITSGFGSIDIGPDNLTVGGTITFGGLSTNGFVKTTGGTGTLSVSATVDLSSEVSGILGIGNGGSPFEQGNGSIFQRIVTQDVLFGGASTTSAKFAFLNNTSGTPTASLSAGLNGGLFLTANGTLATTNKQSLSIGDANTGNILVGDGASDRAGAGLSVRGSTTDQYVAEFYGRDSSYAGFGIFAEANGAVPFIQFGDNAGSSGTPLVDWSLTAASGLFTFKPGLANSSSMMTLSSVGALAIEGELSDLSDPTLQIADNLDIRGNLGTTATASISGRTSFAGLLVDNSLGDIFTASSSGLNRFTIKQNGNIGIGTAEPARNLEIATPVNSAFMKFNGTGIDDWTIGSEELGFVFYDDTDGGAYRMVIGELGNVGIGTTTAPDVGTFAKGLEISGTSAALALTATTGKKFIIGSADTPAGLYFRDETSGVYRMVIDANGKLGINTGVSDVLGTIDARGNTTHQPIASLSGQTSAATLVLDQRGLGDILAASSSGFDRFVIRNNGNTEFNSGLDANLGTWNVASETLPVELVRNATIFANGYLYVLGGRDGNDFDGENAVYYTKVNANGSVGPWITSNNPLPVALEGLSAASVNGYIYVMGGYDGSTTSSAVYSAKINADGSLSPWRRLSDFTGGGREMHMSFTANGYIYIIGDDTSVLYAKANPDGTTSAWQTTTSIAGGNRHGVVAVNGFVYVIAGGSNDLYYARINTDGTLSSFITMDNVLPESLSSTTAVAANGYLYLLGGYDGSNYEDTVRYARVNANGSVGAWMTDPGRLPEGRFEHTSVTANGYIYLLGGSNGLYNNNVWYASTARVSMLANLDLIGLTNGSLSSTSGELGQGSLGGSIFAGNIFSNANLEVIGATRLWGPTLINNALTAQSLYLSGYSGTTPSASISAQSSFAGLVVDNSGTGDLFTASSSGLNRFTIKQNGTLQLDTVAYNTCTALETVNGLLTCGSDDVGAGATNYWQLQNGAIAPFSITADLLIGGTSSSSALFRVTGNSPFAGTTSVASVAANTSFAGLVVDNRGAGDLFTASSSGLERFTIRQNGTIQLSTIPYNNCTALETVNGLLTCGTDDTGATTNYWQVVSPGTLAPFNETVDLLVGGVGTSSAEFAITGIAAGTPTATLSASTNNLGLALSASDSRIQSLNMGTLTLGGISTGNIVLDSGSGLITASDTLSFGGTASISTAGVGTGFTSFTVDNIILDGTTIGHTSDTDLLSLASDALTVNGSVTVTSLAGGATDTVITHSGGTLQVRTIDSRVWGSTLVDGAGATGRLAFWSDTESLSSNANLFFDTTNIRLGIGTTTPFAALDVRGTTNTTPAASISANSTFAALLVDNTGSGDLFTASSSGQNRFTIAQNGNIGINTPIPVELLDITANESGSILSLSSPDRTQGINAYWDSANVVIDSFGQNIVFLNTTYFNDDVQFNNSDLTFVNSINSTGERLGIGTTTPLAFVDIRSNVGLNGGTIPVASLSGSTTFAGLVVDNTTGDLLTASSSGLSRFTIKQNGDIAIGNLTYTFPSSQGTNYILQNNGSGVLSWVDPGTLPSTNYWDRINDVVLTPKYATVNDLLLGGTATDSARFAVKGIASGTPIATLSASTNNQGIYLDAANSALQSVRNNPLTIGGNTTGTITLSPNSGTGDLFLNSTRIWGDTSGNYNFYSVGDANTPLGDRWSFRRTGADDTRIRITTGSTSSVAGVDFYQSGQLGFVGFNNGVMYLLGANGNPLALGTEGTENARFTTTARFGIATTNPLATLQVAPNAVGGGTIAVASTSGRTSFASLVVDNSLGDLFTASSSGLNRFTIKQNGNLVINGVDYSWPSSIGDNDYILQAQSDGTLSWIDPGSLPNSDKWDTTLGALYPKTASVLDLLIGGTASNAAKFAVINVNGSATPVASLSATITSGGSGNGIVLNANGSIQTLRNNTLTLGGDTTGDLLLNPGGATAMTLLSNGNVGIGTTNPNTALHIVTNGEDTVTIQNTNASDYSDILFLDSSGAYQFGLAYGNANATAAYRGPHLYAPNTGFNFFLNSATKPTLALSNTSHLPVASVSANTSFAGLIVDNTTGDLFSASSSGLSRFVITQSGRVGIGTTDTSAATLTVKSDGVRGFHFVNSSDSVSAGITNNGAMFLAASTTFGAVLNVSTGSTTGIGQRIRGVTGQTGDLLQLESASGTNIWARFSANGAFQLTNTIGTTPAASLSGSTIFPALAVDNSGSGDIFTASSSGLSRFTIKQNGDIAIGSLTYTFPSSQGTDYILQNNGSGVLSWIDPGSLPNSDKWDTTLGAIYPKTASVLDLLIGGTASNAAKFAVINVNGSATPVASLSATTASGGSGNGIVLNANGSIQTLRNNTLTIGGDTTGDIVLSPRNGDGSLIGDDFKFRISGDNFDRFRFYNSVNDSTLRLTTNDSSSTTGLEIYHNGGNFYGFTGYNNGVMRITGGTSIPLSLGADDSDFIRLTTTGRLGISTTNPLATLEVAPNIIDGGTLAVASTSGRTSFASLVVDNSLGDLFTASSSGLSRFTIKQNGNIAINGVEYSWPTSIGGTYILQSTSNGTLSWIDPGSLPNSDKWDSTLGAIYPKNAHTLDLLIGGTATNSSTTNFAKFAVLNVNSGTPTASVSAGSAGGAYLTATGTLATTALQTLTLGTGSTGNILVKAGDVTSGTPSKTISITGGSHSVANRTGGSVTITGGDSTSGTGTGDGGDVIITGGDANGSDLGSVGGNITINAGYGQGGIAPGAISIGTFGASTLTLGNVLDSTSYRFANLTNCSGIQTDTEGDLSCIAGGSSNWDTNNGVITQKITSRDLLIGGVSSSSALFRVTGNSPFAGTTSVASVSANSSFAGLVVDNRGRGDLFTASSSGLTRFVINNNGNVGIGTALPTEKLHLVSGSFLQTIATGSATQKGFIKDGVGATDLDGAGGIYVSGKYAYVASNVDDSLTIIDISDPASPTEVSVLKDGVGATDLDGASGVYVAGKYAYVTAAIDDSLTIVDISNPSSPTQVGVIKDGVGATDLNGAVKVYVSGKYAYVAVQNDNALTIIDVSNPSSPTQVGVLKDGVGATDLAAAQQVYVSGKYAYVVASTDGALTIVDVSDPASPTEVAVLKDGVGATDLAAATAVYVSGTYAYVAAQTDNALTVVDISDPSSPTEVAVLKDGVGATDLAGAAGIYVAGRYAYVTASTDDSLTIVDISNPSSPTQVAALKHNAGATQLNGAYGIAVSGKYAYVTGQVDDAMTVIETPGIDAPSAAIGNIISNNITVTENATIGNNLYVANGLNVGLGGIYTNGSIAGNQGLSISNTIGTQPIASLSARTSFAGLVIDNSLGDLFTASSSGLSRFTILQNGTLQLDTVAYNTCTALETVNGLLTCGTDDGGVGSSNWDVASGTIRPKFASVLDLLLGGTSSSSAKFAVLNVNSSATPVASVSATSTGNGIALSGDGTIQSFRMNTLTLGGSTTGHINLQPSSVVGTKFVGIGIANPTATLHIVSANGVSQTSENVENALTVVGGQGGSGATSFGSQGGDGGGISLTGGKGGTGGVLNGNEGQNGGLGGSFTFTAGDGGNGRGGDTGGFDGDGNTGGSISLLAGNGGNGATSFGSGGDAGNGGDIFLSGGAAGTPGSGLTGVSGNVYLGVNSSGTRLSNVMIGYNASRPLASLDVRGNIGTQSVASVSGSTTHAALIVDNLGSGDIFTASSSGQSRLTVKQNGTVIIGNNTNGITFDYLNGGPTYAGLARPTSKIVLSPEYPGATLTASGAASAVTSGAMTSDASTSAGLVLSDGSSNVTNNFLNYYEWAGNAETSLQEYNVAIRFTLPPDFSSWAPGGSAMQIAFNTNLTSNDTSKLEVRIIPEGQSGGASTPAVYFQNQTSSAANQWRTINISANDLTDGGTAAWNTASRSAMIYLKMYAKDANYVQIGDIILNYLKRF